MKTAIVACIAALASMASALPSLQKRAEYSLQCREAGQGNPATSLCAKAQDSGLPSSAQPLYADCINIAEQLESISCNAGRPFAIAAGYSLNWAYKTCTFHYDNQASDITYACKDLGAFVRSAADSCLNGNPDFNLAHCSVTDPQSFIYVGASENWA